jgi:two-component system OmpR family sensor kinase
VFERFYRADPARSRSGGGTGLGLSIVAAIAAAHGGRASLDTTPGSGTTFRVDLPCTATPAGAAGAATETSQPPPIPITDPKDQNE